MKTTRKLKTLIATMLTLAVALTNATLDNITANASTIYQKDRTEMENVGDLADTTVTMKVGDTKKIDFVEDDGKSQKYQLLDPKQLVFLIRDSELFLLIAFFSYNYSFLSILNTLYKQCIENTKCII